MKILEIGSPQLAAIVLAAVYIWISGISWEDKTGVVGAVVICLLLVNAALFGWRLAMRNRSKPQPGE